MTLAELSLTLISLMLLYFLLMPLQRMLESFLLRLLGARGLHIIDVSIIKETKSNDPKE